MKKLNLGSSNYTASAVVLGCMRISEMTKQEVCTLLETAVASGINMFDHADIYGGGKSEQIFADALAISSIKREDIIVQSKCGIRPNQYDLSKEHILEAVDGSLQRLKMDYLDVLLLHRPDTLMEPDEIAEAFDKLYDAGKVRSFGVSNMNPMQMAFLQSALRQKITANQLQFGPAHTGMIDQGINVNIHNDPAVDRDGGVLEYCRMNNITIQAWSPLQYGFFEGVFLNSDKYAQLNQKLEELGEKYGVSGSAAAIAWILRHPANIQAIIGTTNAKRVEEMAKAGDVSMTRQEWYDVYRAAGNSLP